MTGEELTRRLITLIFAGRNRMAMIRRELPRDRLLHHAGATVIDGDSCRKRESEQETAARRRNK